MNRTFFAAFTLAALGFNACTVDGTDSGSNDATEIDANAKNGGEVEVYRSVSSDKYDFRLEAKNGEILVAEGRVALPSVTTFVTEVSERSADFIRRTPLVVPAREGGKYLRKARRWADYR